MEAILEPRHPLPHRAPRARPALRTCACCYDSKTARLRCKSWIAAQADSDGGGPACDCEPRGDIAFAGAVNVRVAAPAARAPAAAAPASRALAAAAAPAAGVALGCSSWAKLVKSSCSSRCGTSQSAAWVHRVAGWMHAVAAANSEAAGAGTSDHPAGQRGRAGAGTSDPAAPARHVCRQSGTMQAVAVGQPTCTSGRMCNGVRSRTVPLCAAQKRLAS
eukprot:scaffold44082_cov69-Phaeocystis_antarctica.AAC.4